MLEHTISTNSGKPWIHLSGRIDSLTSSEVRQILDRLIQEGQRIIVVDLEKIHYTSSAGLRVFMEMQIKLKHVGGEIILFNPADTIMELLEMSCFEQIFKIPRNQQDLDAVLHPSQENRSIQSTEIKGISFQYITRNAAPGEFFPIGSQQKLKSASYDASDAITLSASQIQYGTGLASLGNSFEECKPFFGEAMVIHHNFYFYPAVKRSAVDFMLSSPGDSNIKYQFLHGFGFNGDFSHILSFETTDHPTELTTLIHSIFDLVRCNTVGLVFLAESKGFWGMHLKQVPIQENQPSSGESIFDSNHFTSWMNFPIEPSDVNHIIAGVGIAIQDSLKVSTDIRELLASDKNYHIHAGVFSQEPLTKIPDRFEEELKRVITTFEVSKIQHVLGQSKFANGLIGIIELEG